MSSRDAGFSVTRITAVLKVQKPSLPFLQGGSHSQPGMSTRINPNPRHYSGNRIILFELFFTRSKKETIFHVNSNLMWLYKYDTLFGNDANLV